MSLSRISLALISLLILGACKLSSPYDLHRDAVALSPPEFFGGQNAVFSSRKGSYIFMDFDNGLVKLTLSELDVDKTDHVRSTSLIVRHPDESRDLFFLVYPESGKYSYFPFYYNDEGFVWVKPKKTVKVNTMNALLTSARSSEHQKIQYYQVNKSEAFNLRRELQVVKAAKEKKKKDKKKKKKN
ncbi:hypothetical protein N4R57_08475 [Rhodobacteraceae bacterium D3-12]|nr:hypothetical protein N4R57_08475 [Rhodobacteraceae bacterium D3-12]